MNAPANPDFAASAERTYTAEISDASLSFQLRSIADPKPLGRQIVAATGVEPASDHAVLQWLDDGALESIRLDEFVAQTQRPRFIVFRTDRLYRFQLDEKTLEWGSPGISGAALRTLGQVPTSKSIWLDQPPNADREIGPTETVDLSSGTVERLYSLAITFHIIVNGSPKTVDQPSLTYEEAVQLAFPAAVLNENTAYTITYKRGPAENPAGQLTSGHSVKLAKGMVFNVTPTDKS